MQKVMMKSRVLLMIIVFVLVVTPVTVLAETEKKEEINYVSLGDSLAAGLLFNREIGVGYVSNIVGELESNGYHVTASNKGIPGATSTDVLVNLLNVPELAEADIVTISAGANDLLAGLDILKFENFDPTYLNPVAVEQIENAAKTVAVENIMAAEKVAGESVVEASINIEAISIALDELLRKTAPYEALLPSDVEEALDVIIDHLERAKEKIVDVKGNMADPSQFFNADLENYADLLQDRSIHLVEALSHLEIVRTNIVTIETKIEEFSYLPVMAEIGAGVETVKVLTSIAEADINNAIQPFDTALTALSTYVEKMAEIDSLVANAIEVQQMMINIPDKITTAGQNMGQIIMAVKQANPNAKVYVLGYYNALPYLSEELQEQYTVPLLVGLNKANQAAATATGAIFIPTFDLFEGLHETYLPNPADIHPSEAGYQVIAEAFMSRISESFPKITDPEEEDLEEETPPVNIEEDPKEETPPVNVEEEPEEETPLVNDDEVNIEEENTEEVPLVIKEEINEAGVVSDKVTGNRLPNTATNQYHWLLFGALFLFFGSGLLLLQQKRKQTE